jgi:hypothetical protein
VTLHTEIDGSRRKGPNNILKEDLRGLGTSSLIFMSIAMGLFFYRQAS